jgi:toxin ParE1/3/4
MVIWSNTSKQDLKQIYEYIKRDSVYYAKKVINDIIDKAESIEELPNKGKVVDEFKDENLREILVYSYRLIYRRVSSNIRIIAIVHCKRNLTDELL